MENKILKTSILEYKNRSDSIYLINIIDENNNLVLGIAGLEKSIDDFNEVIRNVVTWYVYKISIYTFFFNYLEWSWL